LNGHQQPVIDIDFDVEGNRLATIAEDGSLRLWDLDTGQTLVSVPDIQVRPPQFVRFCRKPEHELIAIQGSGLGTWVLNDEHIFAMRHGAGGDQLNYSPDSQVLVATCAGVGPLFWDLETAREIVTSISGVQRTGAQFAADGSVWISDPSGLRVWSFERDLRDRRKARVGLVREIISGSLVGGIDLNDSRGLAAVQLGHAQAWVFPVDRASERIVLEGEPNLAGISLHRDGLWVAMGSWNNPKGVCRVWDARTGKAVVDVGGPATTPKFSPDGKWLSVGGGSEYRIYEAGSWKLLHAFPTRSRLNGACAPSDFSPRDSTLAIADENRILRLIDTTTAAVRVTLESPNANTIQEIRFSPDGRWLSASRWDAAIEVWDLGRLQRRLAEFGLDWTTSASR
jgi:hypothetical protein